MNRAEEIKLLSKSLVESTYKVLQGGFPTTTKAAAIIENGIELGRYLEESEQLATSDHCTVMMREKPNLFKLAEIESEKLCDCYRSTLTFETARGRHVIKGTVTSVPCLIDVPMQLYTLDEVLTILELKP